MEKIYRWISAEKINTMIVAMSLLLVNILSVIVPPSWFITKYFNTPIFLISIIILIIMLIKKCKKDKKISLVYLISINIISVISYVFVSGIWFDVWQLWLKAVIFITIVILGLVVVWKAKTKFVGKFNLYLIISLITVILNFGGFYNSLYSIYFRYGLESFKIEQGMTYPQAIIPSDFIYYSADAFFGTDLSDVSLRYNDHNNLIDKNNIASNYIDKYDDANLTIDIVKMFSMLESILFLVYISIIVLNTEGIKKKAES
ncbi:hypothetical protein SAMN04487896_5257 [Paenibacillus sp. ov031]|uniref:hypothetical protein n=1 Tax=Paenibacillus sp. ov031 TaxID=1761879 RepID=UPI000913672F|nr:hypothetical protein [Paenibacillus sp. ov031]SHN83278.1 hypothetical protein SAMN04487896_5257 [Paenibacillus sp. ov031]